MLIAVTVFFITYLATILRKVPESVVSMAGASILIILGIISQENAIEFIDFNTIGLLCGMMILVSILRKTGVFEFVAIKAIKRYSSNPCKILLALSLITAFFSALLDNVTTVLIIAPISLAIADTLKLSPKPFLISVILFANIGGAATAIGSPNNIMIAGKTGLSFIDFLLNNFPIALIISFVVFWLLKIIFHNELKCDQKISSQIERFDENRTITDLKFFKRSLTVLAIIIFFFLIHHLLNLELAAVALFGSFLLMLVTGIHPEEIFKEIKWSTLFFFIGLFIIVGGLENTGIIKYLATYLFSLANQLNINLTFFVLWFSALASSIINNIPYTAAMIPIIQELGQQSDIYIKPLWWALSLGSNLGANGTIIGAAANIIVANFAYKSNQKIGFWEFFKVGFFLMIVSIAITSVYIYFKFLR